MSTTSTSEKGVELQSYWRLLAIGLDPDRPKPELHGLIFEAEKDTPLMVNGRIALFTDPQRARELLDRYAGAVIADHLDLEKPFFLCDVAQALRHLSGGGFDEQASVLSAVNVLLDLVRATNTSFGDRRRAALYDIANYCTFSKDLTKYLEEEGDYSKEELIDAVLWCVGVVAVNSTIV
jgi:hypothetical protein